ncbi:serine/threonine protein kinase [Streptomyces sp. RLB3-17]|uniref:serine/threonine-protein kinase n=1 Tax=Streptomyces TaxID=1883 RepID=UPI001163B13D|nr:MULTISPECIES: serine/threonine-protein kinase [unclassified Streptomyces]NMI61667.1 serine/threonine protein kinase [Streptomyces sp. RLA2-12]QDN60748.1 serine/threonine protein kinase [Streptomyces sp. S1D4-20]QDN70801.1 serine/threonine protein kinase [Streptomyces sp. S1D4-14]QDO43245.1 serine/threonine protein kinase [Streptomyces sp. RLB3-17]QDO53257.1 serine/threonine protein kinase [Streptomyces sp. RLB3-5]
MWDRGTVLGGRYTLAERIGGGAMGDVWRADDTVLERRVAVKILRPELLDDARFAKRFRREALILASLDHPGIVDVHDYGENALGDGSRVAYIVMELVEGRPLDEFLKESGPLPPEQALATTAEALEALHAAHRRQVVHRDIKPSNLLICADGRVKVTDFGLARDLATSKITPEHAVVGTALYIAPEQVEGHGTTPASDLYSMGVVCYKMLTGKLPFDGERAIEILVKHVQQPVPALPADFPQPVRDFVATALAKKPEDRFPDAATMAAAARTAAPAAASSAVAGGAVVSPESGGAAEVMVAPQQGRSGSGRRRILFPLLVACVVTVVVGGVVLIDPSLFQSHTSTRGNEASASASISASTSASGAHSTGASPSPSRSPSASPSASATTNGSAEPVGLPPSSPSTSSAAGGSSVVRPSASATMEPSAYPIAGVSMSDDSAAIKGSGVSAGPAGGCTAWLDNAGSGNLYGMLNTSYFETCHAELIRDDGLTVGLAASSGAERTSVISDIGHTMRICVWQQGASADKQCSATVVIRNGTPTVQ